MRAKEIWALVPVPSHVVKKVYSSVTISKITALYFLFALFHMFIQGGFQIGSHITNHSANNVFEVIMTQASVKGKVIPVITPNQDGSGDTLRLCNGIPQSDADQTCEPVFNAPPTKPPSKQPQEQNAPTTALQDNVSTLSDPLLVSQTGANGIIRPSGVTAPENIASTTNPIGSANASATTSVAAGASNVANAPVASTTSQAADAIAVNPTQVSSVASSASAPAPGSEAPSGSIAPPVSAPSTTVDTPSQAPAPPPAQSSAPPLVDLPAPLPDIPNPLPELPISIALPVPPIIGGDNSSTPPSPPAETSAPASPAAPAPEISAAPAPVPPANEPAPVVSIGLPDVGDVVQTVVDDILGGGQPEITSVPAPVIETPATTSEAAVETPAISIGLPEVGGVVKSVVGDILGGGQPQATSAPEPIIETLSSVPEPAVETSAPPSSAPAEENVPVAPTESPSAAPQTTESTPAPVPEVSLSSAPTEPSPEPPKDTVESVETTEAAKETAGAAEGPIDKAENTAQGATQAVTDVISGVLGRRSLNVEPVFDQTTGNITGVKITDLTNSGSNEVVTIDRTCALALALPYEGVHLAEKEDLVLVGYYVWLFGLAFVAIVNESIPHLIAAFISSVLAVAWSAFQVLRTRAFQSQFNRFITEGACKGVQLLPSYWKHRTVIEIPSLVLNCVFALVLGGLAFKLFSRYRRSTSKLVGGEKFVGHLYKIVLVLSIVIQITMFLIIASLALWVDQLFEGTIASLSKTTDIFKGISIVSLVLAFPWFIIGWIAVRKENRPLMVTFFIVTTLFIASLCGMFGSDAYRLIFAKWPLFGALSVASFFGLVISLGLSVLCRMRFGQGLASQLAANSKAEDEVMPWDFSSNTEKAWQTFESIPVDNNDLQGARPMKGPATGTMYWNTNVPRV